MHISSATNPLSRSEGNVPVAVFVFEDRRKFLRVSEDYSGTLDRVVRAFCIPDGAVLSFHTASLDVCKGTAVEIDESAYPFMWTVLDEIVVKLEKRGVAHPTPRATPLAETAPKAGPSRVVVKKFHGDELAEEEEVAMSVRADADHNEFAETEAEALERELLEAEAEAAAQAEEDAQAESVAEAEATAGDMAWDFADEQPQKGKRRSQTAPVASTSKFKPSKSMYGSTKARDDRSVKSEQTVVEPPRASTSRSVYGSESSRRAPAPPTPAGAADADPRFEITILGPEVDQVAQFKTRGKHPVRKVLAAACRLFELDSNRAHLYLGVSTEKGTRGAVKCEVDATMTQCRVDSLSRLYVRVNDGNEELESEEEDE